MSMWKSIFDRAEAQHTIASASEGVQLVYEFMRAESGYLDAPQVLRQARAPEVCASSGWLLACEAGEAAEGPHASNGGQVAPHWSVPAGRDPPRRGCGKDAQDSGSVYARKRTPPREVGIWKARGVPQGAGIWAGSLGVKAPSIGCAKCGIGGDDARSPRPRYCKAPTLSLPVRNGRSPAFGSR